MKAFSPQGTYLLEHRKYRVHIKHMKECRRVEFPEDFKGVRVYFYGYTSDGCATFSQKPKREHASAITMYTAIAIRNLGL